MKIACEILTLGQRIFTGEVDSVSLPAEGGLMEVLPGHEPLIEALSDGVVKVRQGDKVDEFAVSGGFAKIQPDKISILAEMAERAEAISAEAAEKAVEQARATMAARGKEGPDYEQAAIEYRRLLLRLNIARKRKKI